MAFWENNLGILDNLTVLFDVDQVVHCDRFLCIRRYFKILQLPTSITEPRHEVDFSSTKIDPS